MEIEFEFSAELFLWSGDKASWVFLEVPMDESDQIKEMVPTKRGFGSVPVTVQIGDTAWKTSVFPSKERDAYILPVKKPVRMAEKVDEGDTVVVHLTVAIDD